MGRDKIVNKIIKSYEDLDAKFIKDSYVGNLKYEIQIETPINFNDTNVALFDFFTLVDGEITYEALRDLSIKHHQTGLLNALDFTEVPNNIYDACAYSVKFVFTEADANKILKDEELIRLIATLTDTFNIEIVCYDKNIDEFIVVEIYDND